MKKLSLQLFLSFIPILFLLLVLNSCSTTKNIKYFNDIPDSGQLKNIPKVSFTEPKIQVDDILTIVVSLADPAAGQNINLGNIAVSGMAPSTSNQSTSQPVVSGYLVNKEGDVQLPIVGKVHVQGLTTSEAQKAITAQTSNFYKDPSVIVRYANFKVTVTGEVTKPSTYVMPNEKVTILDALAMAGDLTIYGKRDNILLLRDNENGQKIPYRIDLTKSDIMDKPYYYLRQNDYIYVEPSQGKVAANDIAQARTYAILSSIITVVVVIISRINFK